MSNRPQVFIGSSKESLDVARGLKMVLERVAEVHIWDENVFPLNRITLDALLSFTEKYDFAVFIWSGDDRATIRDTDYYVARDNIVFEAGMFMAAIGKERVFLVAQTNPEVKELTDLKGLNYDHYTSPSDGNFRSALGTPGEKIVQEIQRQGSISRRSPPAIECHGTKYTVPGSNSFWNGLLKKTERRFYLVGSSNKSWVDNTEDQKVDLAKEIHRIISRGGKVKMVSSDAPRTVDAHRRFFAEYLRPCVEEEAASANPGAWDQIAKNLLYAVQKKRSNYGAIVTDKRLVLLPSMNDRDHRDASLVLEVHDPDSAQFQNYEADVERLFTNGFSRRMDVVNMALGR